MNYYFLSFSLSDNSCSNFRTRSLLNPITESSVPSILSTCSLTSGCSIIKPPAQESTGASSFSKLSIKSVGTVGRKKIVAVSTPETWIPLGRCLRTQEPTVATNMVPAVADTQGLWRVLYQICPKTQALKPMVCC